MSLEEEKKPQSALPPAQPLPSSPAPSPASPDPSVTVTKPLDPSKSWREWRRENIGGGQMLFILLLQAFSAGLLDAFAYGDFETFASNRECRGASTSLTHLLTPQKRAT